MYCSQCGAENSEQDDFCASCGQPLKKSGNTQKRPGKKKKTGNIYLVLTALVLIITLVVVSIFNLWPWKSSNKSSTKAQTTETDKQANDNGFSLEAIAKQCPDCHDSLETYTQIIKAAQDWTTTKEKLSELTSKLYTQMQHVCTAQTIQVEDVPYSYKGSFGLYTGDWVGAGPSGKGTYMGYVNGGNMISYEGDWGYGLPNGNGVLYEENYFGDWSRNYTGQMKDGMRNGTGSWIEFHNDSGNISPTPTYRIYNAATYSNDCLLEWIDCVEYYKNTGEIKKYFKAKTDEKGYPLMGETWQADELSPEMKNTLGVAGALFVVGVTVYMMSDLTDEVIRSMTDPHYIDDIYKPKTELEQMEELNNYEERKEKERFEDMKRKREKARANREYAANKLDELESSGDFNSLDYQYFDGMFNSGEDPWDFGF